MRSAMPAASARSVATSRSRRFAITPGQRPAPVGRVTLRPEGGMPNTAANTVSRDTLDHLSVWTLGNTANLNTYARRNNDVTRYGTTVNQRLNEVVSYQAAVERASDRPGMEATASVTVVPRYTSLTLGLSDRQNGSSRYAEIAGSVLATSTTMVAVPVLPSTSDAE